jgi:hypothetical protein
MKASKLCGDVVDAEGAVVSNAEVVLLANTEKAEILERAESGRDGQFSISEQGGGSYKLLVKSPGFQPFLRVVHVASPGVSKDCQQPILVRLEVE